MSDMTQEEAESRVDDLNSRAEALEAEAASRLDALQEYIDEEEHEIDQLNYDALKLVTEARDIEQEFGIGY